jgi:eukaryotic-like serine/threonine-protein kinase
MTEFQLPTLTPAEARLIDQICDRFEATRKSGQRPDVKQYLDGVAEPARSALLRHLLLLDLDYKRQTGSDPLTLDYQTQLPDDTALINEVCREASQSDLLNGIAHADQSGASRYQELKEVGHGGIGVVFRGRDRILGRELAVKVLRETYRDNPEARRRFIDEARIGSQLQHPAIVPVYETGSFDDGRPYFTMKLVEGHTLAELLRQRENSNQDLLRLLGIFEQICQAMAYAHSRGVVHRDLKPANVMVGEFGEVQVMDWGFAKQLHQVGPTGNGMAAAPDSGIMLRDSRAASHSGMLMGTPAYMPPEQARGQHSQVDRRTDVFAIGAILCEILTGWPPYVADTADEVCRQAMTGDLTESRARIDNSGADSALQSLVKRCLAVDRDDRPEDAAVIVSELTNYFASAQERLRQSQLDTAAAEARAGEALAKARAETRARKLMLGLALTLLAGAGLAAWQAVVATRAKQDALIAEAAQLRAMETSKNKESETRAILEFVQKRVFATARPKGQAGGLGYDVKMRDALVAALPMVEKSFADQPVVEAQLRLTLADSFSCLGEWNAALEQQLRARALFTAHLGPDDPHTITSVAAIARSYMELGQHHESLRLREELLPLLTTRMGPDNPQTLAAMNNVAASYYMFGRYDDASRLFQQALPLLIAKKGEDDDVTLGTMNNLAASYAALDQLDDALELYERTLRLRRAKIGLGPDHPDTLVSMNNLANCYVDLDRHDDALKLREQTLAKRRVKLGMDHPETWISMGNLASSYGHFDRHAEALTLRQEVLDRRTERFGLDNPDTLWAMWDVAHSLVKLGRGPDALPIIDDCLKRAAHVVVDPDLIPGVMDQRIKCFEQTKDAIGCRATAEMWEGMNRADAKSLFSAARYRAVTAKIIRATDVAAIEQANAEADRALAWLEKANAAGYKNKNEKKTDADFDALRDRADFQKLIASVNATKKSDRPK